jgi:PPOX class probable F420-dependent enzyme
VTEVDRLASGQYLSLTTFRRTGAPVATPVWVTRRDEHLYVITSVESGKVKRLRHTSRVLLAPCDVRGRITGAQVPGSARLLDADGTAMVRALVNDKYGLLGKLMARADQLLRGRGQSREQVGIEIAVLSPPRPAPREG